MNTKRLDTEKITALYERLSRDDEMSAGDSNSIVHQIKELDECAKLLRYTSNNVNQIARRVNSGGGVYPDEVDEICGKLTEASGLFGNILEQLSKIK